MKIIKLTTPWKHPFFYNHTKNGEGIVGDYKFEIDNDCKECDFWIVYGGLNPEHSLVSVKCPKDNIIFLGDEVHSNRFFLKGFLDQFPTVVSPRKDIAHRNVLFSHELNTWHLKKTFDELINLKNVVKTKEIAAISSNLFLLEGHQKRFAYINKLMGHFKDKIDVYGRGIKPFDDKFETLLPYKYSIAIENSQVPGYFTEKISECYLTHTMPLYYGCPNIEDYFSKSSYVWINIDDFKQSIQTIEKILDENLYDKHLNSIIEQKEKYLSAYDLFPGLTLLLDQHFTAGKKKEICTIKRESNFDSFYRLKRLFQIYNNRSFIPENWKFDVNFRKEGEYSNKK